MTSDSDHMWARTWDMENKDMFDLIHKIKLLIAGLYFQSPSL